MRNFLSTLIFAILLSGCNQGTQSKAANESKSVTFSGIDSIHSKSKTEIEKYLKQHDFKFQSLEDSIYSWKSKKDNEAIHFSGTGALTFQTESKSRYDSFINEIKNMKYENTDVQDNETMKILTFTKGEKSLLLSSMQDYENGKGMFTLTFMDFDLIK
ncbi:hypothetical protein G6N05_00705 [Flavobacterium sp. F372]|jgi:uncharacterized protein YceK|uniref:DUF4252 domain-containing protein n=1 Tax=Flavobacterium bernardetii TaxID=2813823 RepID=A0ABR7IUJ8_9FLAO|nr:hypothetical protein [Flavobacterium bernardetii]MBC5833393.1 hypothetical protein [Flavobacterium bernardetii]NHF68625.1 hypothetical protein [Flavobacterium bernardetii]